jgi:hypothetical protein
MVDVKNPVLQAVQGSPSLSGFSVPGRHPWHTGFAMLLSGCVLQSKLRSLPNPQYALVHVLHVGGPIPLQYR